MLDRVIAKLREVGPRYAIVLLLSRFVPPHVLSASRIVVLHLPTSEVRRKDPIGRWADSDELPLLTGFGHEIATLVERFARGDRAWIMVEGDRLVGYCWFTQGDYHDEATGLAFPSHPGEVWLYDAMVHRDQRGRGIYPRLLAGAARQLGREGVRGIRIIVEALNRNSIRAHEAGGAVVREAIRAVTLFGRQRVERRELA
ncbi:MAG: GNAT family N-acetyltransferase [Myxococcota bacterium]